MSSVDVGMWFQADGVTIRDAGQRGRRGWAWGRRPSGPQANAGDEDGSEEGLQPPAPGVGTVTFASS